ncbi:MAG: CBS domain-containing protein [Pseudomonadota bacterium]
MIVRKIIESKRIQQILTIKADQSVKEATELLAKNKVGAIVVSEDGISVDGILSERDIVGAIGRQGPDCLGSPVSSLMTTKVSSCSPDDTSEAVMERMTDGRFRHMPVMTSGRMVGVISIGDVVKARISEIEQENSALTGMIANNW